MKTYIMQLDILLLTISGIFYLACAIFIWKPFKNSKNDLISAMFAFFCYQAVSMFFMGVEMYTKNLIYSNISALAVFIGSAYMLKFPLSKLPYQKSQIIFKLIIISVLAIFTWFMINPERYMMLMHFTIWYDLIINGIVVGGSMLFFATKLSEKFLKQKTIYGGVGVMTCCVMANAAMLSGFIFTSTIFGFLAPLIILYSIKLNKNNISS